MGGTQKLAKFDLHGSPPPENEREDGASPSAEQTTDRGSAQRERVAPPGDMPPFFSSAKNEGVRSEPASSDANAHAPPAPLPARQPLRPEPQAEIASGSKDPAALRTRLAKKFATLADEITQDFSDFSIGAGAWGVDLTAPTGMSTGGGTQQMQHLRLRPRRSGCLVLVGGIVNSVEKSAELRDFEHITMMDAVRFKRSLEITYHEWEQFLRKAEVVLNKAGIQSQRVAPTNDLVLQTRVPGASRRG